MSAVPSRPYGDPYGLLTGIVLAGALALFATGAALPWYLGVAIAVFAVGAAAGIRAKAPDPMRQFALAPVLAALVALAAFSIADPVPELFGAGASMALLLWLTADPREAPGGIGRAATALLLVSFVVLIAWASALALPSRNAVVGLAGGLLVLAIVVLAVFVGRPDFLDRDGSANP